MKYTLITLVALLLIIGGIAIYKGNQVNDLKADLKHLNNINDIEVEIKVEDIRKHLTDSIDKAYELRTPLPIIKDSIITKYETITNNINSMPLPYKYSWGARKLDSIHRAKRK